MDDLKHIKVTCYITDGRYISSHRVCDSNITGKVKVHYDPDTKDLVINIFDDGLLDSDWIKKNQDIVDLSNHSQDKGKTFNW